MTLPVGGRGENFGADGRQKVYALVQPDQAGIHIVAGPKKPHARVVCGRSCIG